MRALFQILMGVARTSPWRAGSGRGSGGSPRRCEVEQPLRAEAVAQHLPKQLERDGSEQEHELPVDSK